MCQECAEEKFGMILTICLPNCSSHMVGYRFSLFFLSFNAISFDLILGHPLGLRPGKLSCHSLSAVVCWAPFCLTIRFQPTLLTLVGDVKYIEAPSYVFVAHFIESGYAAYPPHILLGYSHVSLPYIRTGFIMFL